MELANLSMGHPLQSKIFQFWLQPWVAQEGSRSDNVWDGNQRRSWAASVHLRFLHLIDILLAQRGTCRAAGRKLQRIPWCILYSPVIQSLIKQRKDNTEEEICSKESKFALFSASLAVYESKSSLQYAAVWKKQPPTATLMVVVHWPFADYCKPNTRDLYPLLILGNCVTLHCS